MGITILLNMRKVRLRVTWDATCPGGLAEYNHVGLTLEIVPLTTQEVKLSPNIMCKNILEWSYL